MSSSKSLVSRSAANTSVALPKEWQGDAEIALTAIKSDVDRARFDVSQELWDSQEFVIRAVHEHGLLLEHASQRLREDRQVVLQALKSDLTVQTIDLYQKKLLLISCT